MVMPMNTTKRRESLVILSY